MRILLIGVRGRGGYALRRARGVCLRTAGTKRERLGRYEIGFQCAEERAYDERGCYLSNLLALKINNYLILCRFQYLVDLNILAVVYNVVLISIWHSLPLIMICK